MEWWFRAYTLKRSRVSRWFRSLERDNIVCRSQYLPRGPSELGQPCSEFSSWSVSLVRTFRNTETCFIAATLSLSLSLGCSSFSRREIILALFFQRSRNSTLRVPIQFVLRLAFLIFLRFAATIDPVDLTFLRFVRLYSTSLNESILRRKLEIFEEEENDF